MTVSTTNRSITHTGNGTTTVWSWNFIILQQAHLSVQLIEIATSTVTTLLDSEYSIVGGIGNPAGGTLQYPLTGSPLASTHQIRILRTVPLTQETDIENQGGFFPSVIEDRFDLNVMMIQQIAEDSADAQTIEASRIAAVNAAAAAATSESNAATSETNASASASSAAGSESNSALSATNAANSATAAQVAELSWEGPWSISTAYTASAPRQAVANNGSSYVCIANHTASSINEPGVGASWTSFWEVLAAAGTVSATFNDNDFIVQDNLDNTKKFRFQAAGITSATTRTLTIPDADDTLMVLGVDQTVTGSITFGGALGAEGGELTLEKPVSSTSITDDIKVDVNTDLVRIFEGGGTNRGVNLNVTECADTVGSSLWHDGNIGGRIATLPALTSPTVNPGADRFIIRDLTDGLAKTVVLDNIRRGAPDAVLEDQKAQNTNGGSPITANAFQMRDLNTKVKDTFNLITLASNQFTPSEFGWVRFVALGSRSGRESNFSQTRLVRVDTAAVIALSMPNQFASNNSTTQTNFIMEGGGAVLGGVTYQIETVVSSTTGSVAFGRASNRSTEIYLRVEYWRD